MPTYAPTDAQIDAHVEAEELWEQRIGGEDDVAPSDKPVRIYHPGGTPVLGLG